MGSHVIVTEVNPIRALEAVMDGFTVMSSMEAARVGEVFITVTGGLHTVGRQHLEVMADGAIIANSGHFNVEIDIPALEAISTGHRTVRDYVEEYTTKDGRHLYLLGEGRLINLAAAEGHPSAVMDMSFANQALSVEYLIKNRGNLAPGVHVVPVATDQEVGRLKLESMGVKIDKLSAEQQKYQESWESGT
jgi:adenosylhomocysteinase